MALFKPMIGADRTALDKQTIVPGYVWFTTGDGRFYVDWKDANNVLHRDPINGRMTEEMVTKLDGIATGANKYTHPTTAGNKHIPTGGSSGQILRWSASGTAVWGDDNDTTYSAATTSADGLMTAAMVTKLNGIASGANAYTHPSHTSKSSGLYKITVDSQGHVSAATAVAKADITGLGIPAQDTTYSAATATAAGLVSTTTQTFAGDKTFKGSIIADGNNSTAGYVKIYESTEGGNITVHGPSDGYSWEMDALDTSSFRLIATKAGTTPTHKIFTFDGTDGSLSMPGTLSAKAITITDTASGKHIAFSRAGWNYVIAPPTGTIAFCCADAVDSDNATVAITADGTTLKGTTNVATGTLKLKTLNIPTSSSGSTYGAGTSGQVLKSNGTTVYWGADSNTTYSAGTGISISSSNQISNSGVRSISTGSTNGTISVNTNGSSAEVAVKGLGSNAYTSTEYLPLAGGTVTGDLMISNGQSTAGFVKIYESSEGGNVIIHGPANTYSWELDAQPTSSFRIIATKAADSSHKIFTFDGTTGSLSMPGSLTIGSRLPAIKFTTVNYNYLQVPAGGGLCLTVGDEVNEANSLLIAASSAVRPGSNNAVSLGTTGKRWSNIYITGQLDSSQTGGQWITGRDNATVRNSAATTTSTASFAPIISSKTKLGSWEAGVCHPNEDFIFSYTTDTDYDASPKNNNSIRGVTIKNTGVLMGAAWNDYAEYREVKDEIAAGRVVIENGNDTLSLATERLMPGANIVSDTFGFVIGETEKSKTPLAVSGRALAYPYEDRNTFKAGDPVCSGPNGTVSKMTREEVMMYPDRMIGTVSAIPEYETWGTGNVAVNGRIWIKIL